MDVVKDGEERGDKKKMKREEDVWLEKKSKDGKSRIAYSEEEMKRETERKKWTEGSESDASCHFFG